MRILIYAVLLLLAACAEAPRPTQAAQQPIPVPKPIPSRENVTIDTTQLTIREISAGSGKEAVAGKRVLVHYTGWLYDAAAPELKGKQFDSSRTRGVPFDFVPGAGRVIRGWEQGVPGMKVGAKRLLVIPPQLAYGERGAGGVIPPNAILVFEVELVDVAD
jgi:FKBP-type peptidyl-prolyl cis-trans isomerase FkpA